MVIRNGALGREYSTAGGKLSTVAIHNYLTGQAFPVTSEEFLFEGEAGTLTATDFQLRETRVEDLSSGGKRLVFVLEDRDTQTEAQVQVELGDEDHYIRKIVSFRPNEQWRQGWLRQVTVEDATFPRETFTIHGLPIDEFGVLSDTAIHMWQIQSYPVLGESLWAGLEFPLGHTWVRDDSHLTIRHDPNIRPSKGWYVAKPSVIGVGRLGTSRRAFEQYLDEIRVKPTGPHFNYNAFWTLPTWTDHNDIIRFLDLIRTELYEPYGVSFDNFIIDAGWADPQSIWEVHAPRYPSGGDVAPLAPMADAAGTRMGFWVSPGGIWLDRGWAISQGYEFEGPKGGCFQPGTKYRQAFTEALIRLIEDWGAAAFKFDSYRFKCFNPDYPHLPGDFSREQMVEGFAGVLADVRAVLPDVWFEEARLNVNFPSPWWLMYFNSVTGPMAADSPTGIVPSPVQAQSKLTARDHYFVTGLKTAYQVLAPLSATEVLGVVHQDLQNNILFPHAHDDGSFHQETGGFHDEAITVVSRGGMFVPFYSDLRIYEPEDWRFLAHLMKWARANEELLAETRIIGGLPQLAQVYGFAHFKDGRALVHLRNPFMTERTHDLRLDDMVGIPSDAGPFVVRKIYPYQKGIANGVRAGDTMKLRLGGYETALIEIVPEDALQEPVVFGARYRLAEGTEDRKVTVWPEARGGEIEVVFPGGKTVDLAAGDPLPMPEITRLGETLTENRFGESDVDRMADGFNLVHWRSIAGITGDAEITVQNQVDSTLDTKLIQEEQTAISVQQTFEVEIPNGVTSTLYILVESETPLLGAATEVLVNGELAQVRAMENDHDLGHSGNRRISLHQRWIWYMIDLSPGRHVVSVDTLIPPVPHVRHGIWLGTRQQLIPRQETLLGTSATDEAAPGLFLPEEDTETHYFEVLPLHTINPGPL